MNFDWHYANGILPSLADGARLTVIVTLLGMVVACVLGLILAIADFQPYRPVRVVTRWVAEFLRNTPLLVQLYILYYLLPQAGITLPAFATGVVALGLQYAAYVSETYRAGIQAVPRGQWEASHALGMPVARTWIAIILPQALRRIVPALGTFMIGMFKDTPILFTIGIPELLGKAMAEGGTTYQYTEPILMVGVFFLLMSVPSAYVLNRLNRRLARQSAT